MGRLLDVVEPLGRATRLRMRHAQAARLAARTPDPSLDLDTVQPVFLLGCGRSGTTLLGELMSSHPEAHYLLEPYHLWAAVDERTDASHIYSEGPGLFIMDESHANADSQARFGRVFLTRAAAARAPYLVEKTPINTYRIAWLNQIAPRARCVCLLRDGVDVALSISRLAARKHARISGKADMNYWWGVGDAKWKNLARDGARVGCLPDAIDAIHNDIQRGAYEWILSHHEVERQREALDDRLLMMNYVDLVARPIRALSMICEFLGAAAPEDWLVHCSRMVKTGRGGAVKQIELPESMVDRFNELQASLGFAGRAVSC